MQGFYKYEDPTMHHAPNFVKNKAFTLLSTDADTTQEVGGWKWCDTEDDAYTYFGVTKKLTPEEFALLTPEEQTAILNA